MSPILNILRRWKGLKGKPSSEDIAHGFQLEYSCFKELLDSNTELLNIIADIEEKLKGRAVFGMSYVWSQSARAVFHALRMVKSLDALSGHKYPSLFGAVEKINGRIREELGKRKEPPRKEWLLTYPQITVDMLDLVGSKNANLGEVHNRMGIPIPGGFAITTKAFEDFLDYNDLFDEINKKKMELDPNDPGSMARISEEIQRLIISARVPPELERAILSAYDRMVRGIQEGPNGLPPRVAMRSSAIGEDSELSYAGQYVSALNVPPDRLIQTYQTIVASLYTPRAISYRLSQGIRDEDIAMGVACLQMVESIASGVMYSRDPVNLLEDHIIITAVWGLGPYAVDGVITPDTYTVSKDGKAAILSKTISQKPVRLVSNPEGGLMEISVPMDKQGEPCLSEGQIRTLAGYALKLEKHYGAPQDIEWTMDGKGDLFVLQTRPFRLQDPARAGLTIPKLEGYPLLVEKGAVACSGVGSGPAFHVHSDEDLARFPDGGVLVAKHSSPKFVVVMQRVRAIVTDAGSVAGHMASLAREFDIPCVLDAKVATTAISPGVDVTVDAYSGRVYQGRVPELLALQRVKESPMKGTPVYESLRQLADLIVPLHLLDPKSPDFAPRSCRTLHDIVRFVHEMSYSEMFKISDLVSQQGKGAVKLDAQIPLDLYMIDLGGGLSGVTGATRTVTPEKIASVPLKALLRGMLNEDLRWHGPRPIQLGGFFSVMAEQMLSSPNAGERFGDRSYAIVSDKYLNFSSRVGYHYSILDCYCGQTINKNYITFSFKGGAADEIRRNRRARAIAIIMRSLDFAVEVMGDRVDARFQKYEKRIMEEKLDMTGRVLQFTRQMDMLMNSEASVKAIADRFLEGNYDLEQIWSGDL